MTFRRSPLRPRKQNRWPLKGSWRSTSCTCNDSEGKAAPHIGVTGRQPHPHAGGDWDHDLCFRPAALQGGTGRSRTSRTRFNALVSIQAPTRTSRPFPSSISMRSSVCVASVGGQVCASGEGAGFPCGAIAAAPAGGEDMVTGTKTAALRRA